MKRAILVVGPESSGTRLATHILIEAGCAGKWSHDQDWDIEPPKDEELIVWRRSVPHAGCWPDIREWIDDATRLGYMVEVVITVREWPSNVRSQIPDHVEDEVQAEVHMRWAYSMIFEAIAETSVPFAMLVYEGLVARPMETQVWLAHKLDLPRIPKMDIFDANAKHWGEEEA